MRSLNSAIQETERGAVAVMVAILVPVLAGFTALAVDIGAARIMQIDTSTAADAAALAIAADCLAGDCGNTTVTAGRFVAANVPGADTVAQVSIDGSQVQVTVATQVDLAIAPILGLTTSKVTATATAGWSTGKVRLIS